MERQDNGDYKWVRMDCGEDYAHVLCEAIGPKKHVAGRHKLRIKDKKKKDEDKSGSRTNGENNRRRNRRNRPRIRHRNGNNHGNRSHASTWIGALVKTGLSRNG